jgi:DDE superfamily endonuclease
MCGVGARGAVAVPAELYASLTAPADSLFELPDAVLRADGPVRSLVELTLTAERRRGHGSMYDALGQGEVAPQRIRRALTAGPLPLATDGRIVLAVDVSPWLRSDAAHQLRPAVLPRLRPGDEQRTVDPGLALLVRRRPRTRVDVVNGAAGHGPTGPPPITPPR